MSVITVMNCHIGKLSVLILILFHIHNKKVNKYLNSDFLLYLFNLFTLYTKTYTTTQLNYYIVLQRT